MFRHRPGLLILPKLKREQSINVPCSRYPFSVQNFVKIKIPMTHTLAWDTNAREWIADKYKYIKLLTHYLAQFKIKHQKKSADIHNLKAYMSNLPEDWSYKHKFFSAF